MYPPKSPAFNNRIQGKETEYAFYADVNTDPTLWVPPAERTNQMKLKQVPYDPIIERLPSDLRDEFDDEVPSRNGFTGFGCVYREPEGGFGEVATGESANVIELIRRGHRGDEYTHKIGNFLHKLLQDEEMCRRLLIPTVSACLSPIELIVKRTLGPNGTSCGMHASYLGLREIDLQPVTADFAYGPVLMSHLVTYLWSFAGGVRKINGAKNFEFVAGAKLSTITTDYNESTTTPKPLVNTRDQPHADPSIYRRIHVTSGDGNMWPWPEFMRFTTTSLVLRLIENGVDCSDVILDDSVAASQICAMAGIKSPEDLSSRIQSLAVMVSGKTIHPLELQLKLIDKCENMAKTCYITPEEAYALKEWRRICEIMLTDTLKCGKYVEFIGKLMLGSSALERRTVDNRDVIMDWNGFENAWCDINPAVSLGIRTREQLESQQTIMQLDLMSYQRTRHDARAEAIAWGQANMDSWPTDIYFYWDKLSTFETIEKLDPYDDSPDLWIDLLRRTRDAKY